MHLRVHPAMLLSMSNRIYMTRSSVLDEALEAAPAAGVVGQEGAPASTRARAWAVYGYRRWREDMERAEKIAAYRAIGEDDEHLEAVRASTRRAVEAGIL